jgi:hypothetical protein
MAACVPVHDKAVLGAGFLGTPAAADTIDFFCPAGTKVLDLAFCLDDCDTGAAFVFSVGYRPVSASTDRWRPTPRTSRRRARPSARRAGASSARSSRSFEEDVYITLTVGTAPAGIAGNPEIHMVAGVNAEGPK